ncbi:hypothetical protein D3C75_1206480 [compost metagenome]
MLLLAENPRMLMLSPEPPPPSPALKVMPETLDSTWRKPSACWRAISGAGTTVMVCGVSSSGATYLTDAEYSLRRLLSAWAVMSVLSSSSGA